MRKVHLSLTCQTVAWRPPGEFGRFFPFLWRTLKCCKLPSHHWYISPTWIFCTNKENIYPIYSNWHHFFSHWHSKAILWQLKDPRYICNTMNPNIYYCFFGSSFNREQGFILHLISLDKPESLEVMEALAWEWRPKQRNTFLRVDREIINTILIVVLYVFMRVKDKIEFYLTTNDHIDMSELWPDENWLELCHVFPEHSFEFLNYFTYSVLLPVSIHKYYVDNIITNMSFPFNLKLESGNGKQEPCRKFSLMELISSALYFFASKFGSENSGRVSEQQYHQSGLKVSLSDFHLSLIQMGETKAGNGMVKLKWQLFGIMPEMCWNSTLSIWIKPLNGLKAIVKCCNHLLFIILGEWQKCWDMEHYLVFLMGCVHTLCPSHISSHIETTWTINTYIFRIRKF